ncbi:MAG: hypothetical protein AUJ92_21075 [Armatimonadetes bacterium CG2_30_59_28]|nr:hypothetical protein [Armatimonadota bacterium]OIO89581.1 MAG: hypothetical protein AUJ92_21075 [Armatimonadetes bacterium CG2_30_59_28]PIX45860.1 MAG: hypothetical protein COZ56_00860 [Armatimonadetes bacterium CG_4_8_14_3_um_filter_58_9]PIY41556.1 MAG: hypothetical protein COZ05_15465 [Armatimonadetes bacterium CG_4_10_14_3_um_filter_59_10]PJB76833.1 MAG: hypothetical protein CO095_02090 [Armatimonadetes bacterium CG_4_9_14_3_um_filter_58_7]
MSAQYAEVASDGHLALPEETYRKLHLGPGMKFELLTDHDSVLVLKLMSFPTGCSSATDADLRMQQAALNKIWGDPVEDIYNDDV